MKEYFNVNKVECGSTTNKSEKNVKIPTKSDSILQE